MVVTGCMAERYGDELAAALPEVDAVVGFSGEGSIASIAGAPPPSRCFRPAALRVGFATCWNSAPAASAPWAYLKIAEGCDHACAFCAIPSFRGKQRSRTADVDRRRGRCPRGRRCPRTRARRARSRLVRPRPRDPRSRSSTCSARSISSRRRAGTNPALVPLPVGGPRPARRRMLELPIDRAVLRPLAPARRAATCCGA